MRRKDGKLLVAYDTIPSKTHGSQKHWYKIYCVESGRVLAEDGPFRDKTEADNAALDVIKAHDDWDYNWRYCVE
jgi:hypothetical protein